jgi:hypothetical protein
MSAIKYLRVIGLTLILLVTLVGQGQAQGQQPPPPTQPAVNPPSFPPMKGDLIGGAKTPAQTTSNASKSAIALGAPGTSFRYVQTFGVTEQPYIGDTAHLNFPWGITTDGTKVLIGEYWGRRVLTYTSTGDLDGSIGRAGISYNDGEMWGIFDMAVDSGGNTWVVDVDSSQVYQFDSSGAYLDKFKDGAFDRPSGIAFDAAGNVYISEGGQFWNDDYGGQRIQIYDSAGNYLSTIGEAQTFGLDNNHFHGPQHIAIYGTMLYVADGGNNRVQIFNISTPAAPVYSATLGTAGESGSDNTHFNHPVGVAVDANYIFIADRWNNRIQVFSQTTRAYVATIGTGLGTGNDQFNNPTDVAIDSAGNLYVADFANCRVQQFNSSHVYQRTYGVTGVPYITDAYHYNSPSGVAIASDGSIYLTEDNGQRLIKLNPAGVPQWAVGVAGIKGDFFETTNDNLNNPSDVALDASGRVYVADQWHGRVQIFNSNGSYYATLGLGTDNYEFWQPVGLTIASNGYIYVTDASRNRVQVFDANRNYVATLGVTDVSGSDSAHFNGPQDVAVDSTGLIYVADTNNHRVQVFNASRVYLRTMGVTGECNASFDHFCSPDRLLIDASDRLFVADQWNNRVQVFDKNGVYLTTLSGAWGGLSGQFRNPHGLAVDTAGNLFVADWQNHRIQKFAIGTPGWRQSNINGFGEPANRINSLGSFGSQMYAGTFNGSGNGAQLWRSSDGKNWSSVMADGFGDATNVGIDHLIEYNGKFYAGTWNETATDPYTNGGQIWRSSTGNSGDWSKVVDNGFGDPTNGEVMRLAVFNNQIYAGTWSYTPAHGAEIWRSPTGNDGDWTRVVDNGLADATNAGVVTMEIFNGYLYVGTYSYDSATSRSNGCEVWRTDGVTWIKVVTDGFGDLNCSRVSLAAYGDSLYAGTGIWNPDTQSSPGGQVWRCTTTSGCDEASDWTLSASGGFGNPQNRHIYSLLIFDSQLYAVTGNFSTGLEVWFTSNGASWEQVGFAGFGDSNNQAPFWDNSVTVFNNRLFIGTMNWANGGEIWQLLNQIYLPLVSGWNLVSFNLHPDSIAITDVLASLDSNFDLVYAWDATGGHAGAGNWMRYAPGIPGNTLDTLDETQGFWIRMLVDDTLEITGTAPTTTNISLSTTASGWNLVGYPSDENRGMPEALATHGVTDYSLVYAYHADETDTWKRYAPGVPGNDLLELTPGWGYWIKVSATSTWDVEY